MTLKRGEPYAVTVLREEIESVDRSLTLLLAARLDAAERAIRQRMTYDAQVTDREQEARVLYRSRRWADELGLPRRLVDHLFRSLIEEGKARALAHGTPPEPPVVTVLLDSPARAEPTVERAPRSQLVPVATAR